MDHTTPYLPIDAYGAIGNNDRCALVGRDGSIDWCCFPHLESPSVFAAILDADAGGCFAITPTTEYETNQSYVDRTNVLETTFETDSGTATLTDFMPVREGEISDERFQQSIYRMVTVEAGTIDLRLRFEPRLDYARAPTALERDDGAIVARTADSPDEGRTHEPADEEQADLYLETEVDVELEAGNTATGSLSLEAGDTRWVTLSYGSPAYRSPEEYDEILAATISYWRTWLDSCEASATELFEFEDAWRESLERSALVLKLLIHEETGAIPAAPTASLPEEIGGTLNWDYRYNWIRDAKFTIQALHSVGQADEAHRYFEWFRAIGHEEPADIQPLYGLHSETAIGEAHLEHLEGYRESTPVRIGNAAADQEQLDIYGTIIQGIYETIRYQDGLTEYDWESVTALANYVCDHWDERDKSIWEFRDLHEHFVHSKLLCWVALDRALRLAEAYDPPWEPPLERWETNRSAIRDAIEIRGYNEDLESFVQFFGAEEALDATALLIPIYDFLPADDDRVLSTIETILEELTTDDGLVVRFANSPARPREPGGFVLCSFWLVDALVLAGRLEDAEAVFEHLLSHTSDLGLLSEMIRTDDGTFLGNYPQAFSHIGLINSAIYLASAGDAEGLPLVELDGGPTAPLFRQHGS